MSERTEQRWGVVPVFGARDVRAAVAYYRDQLGFSCDPENGVFGGVGDEGAVYAILQRNGVAVHLQIRRRELPADRERIESDAYFYVEDADALHVELAGRGARIVRSPMDGPNYGLRDFVVEDLDGNRLLFGSPRKG